MNENIRRCLKERSKLTKFFIKTVKKGKANKNRSKSSKAKAAYCTEQTMKAKNNYTLIMTNKLNNPKVASKICWSILHRFLYNKKFQQPPVNLCFLA